MTSIAAQGADSIAFTCAFDCTQPRLWQALTDPGELSAWLGGDCALQGEVGGRVHFDLPQEQVNAAGVVRSFIAPRPDRRVALIEHTFVDAVSPDMTSICRWAVRATDSGCELVFTHDGFGEADRARLEAAWKGRLGQRRDLANVPPRLVTSPEQARALLRAARRVLLVSFIGPEVPEALLDAGFDVYAKVGPEPNAWAHCSRHRDAVTFVPCSAPNKIDLVHLDVADAFAEYLEVARVLGARTFWFHSARTCPPQPHDDRGCWLPAAQSRAQRTAALAIGLAYIDDHYIADVAQALPRR